VYEYKRDSDGCCRCGESDPACLDFHHRDDTEKEMNISEMITHGFSKAKLRAEMQKCVILCANCHRKEYYEVPTVVQTRQTESVSGGE
jgi:hypothetical protein